MSYDISFGADEGGREQDSINYTSNVAPMWRKAMGISLGDLIERSEYARELVTPLTRGINVMAEMPEEFRAMNPDNGWGNYEGALEVLITIRDFCRDNPLGGVSVWR